ncbi:MAG: sulfatase [Alphaproteobacteria bacterium]|nr:sulfatase [Alphaproteobacteria bacterium]
MVDDLNTALGSYGTHPTAKTPNIDAFAAGAVRFERAYAQDPLCSPSRASFLSGHRPATTGVVHNFQPWREVMREGVVLLPEYLEANGYFTARVGKVGHSRYEDAVRWSVSEDAWSPPADQYLPGEDASEIKDNSWAVEGAADGLSRTEILGHHDRTGGMPLTWRATGDAEAETQDGRTTRRIIELLREHREGPFFFAAGYHKPHQPWVAPAPYFEQHPVSEVSLPETPADDRADIPKVALSGYPEDGSYTDDQKRQAIAAYHATVTLIDDQVGMLLAALEELGLAETTAVVFFGDHGFQLGEHGGLWRKSFQFEQSTRVPLIVRVPGLRAGETTDALVELVDLYPTLVELAGLPLPDGLEGTSFRPLLETELPWKQAIFSGTQRRAHRGESVRTARYRYTEWRPLSGEGPIERELYDLETDPDEFVNLADKPEHEALQRALAALLERGWKGALPH